MNRLLKFIFIFLLVYIFISACATFIPVKKYQQSYFNLLKEFQSKPQEHYDKQVEYANYAEKYEKLSPELIKTKATINNTNEKHITVEAKEQENIPLKAKYIRDKNNPDILHPYQGRKFLFFKIYK